MWNEPDVISTLTSTDTTLNNNTVMLTLKLTQGPNHPLNQCLQTYCLDLNDFFCI